MLVLFLYEASDSSHYALRFLLRLLTHFVFLVKALANWGSFVIDPGRMYILKASIYGRFRLLITFHQNVRIRTLRFGGLNTLRVGRSAGGGWVPLSSIRTIDITKPHTMPELFVEMAKG